MNKEKLVIPFSFSDIAITYFVVFLTACGESPQSSKDEKSFSRESVPETVSLSGKKYFFDQLKSPLKVLVKDGHLIVGESRRIPPEYPPVHIFDLQTKEYMSSKGVIGFGPCELSDAWILDKGGREETFWVYSIMEKRFSEFNLNDTLELSQNQIKQSGDFFMAVAMAWASDSTVMCRLADDKYRFVEFHIDGTRVGEFGLWTDMFVREDLNDYMMSELHLGWFKGNREKNIYVSAGAYRDRLEILDKNNGKIIVVDGPENHIPNFKISNSKAQASTLIVDINEPLAFLDIYVEDEHIYGLYCGRTEKQMREGDEMATEIFVFDLQGNIQYQFKLDQSIRALAVDESSKEIFGITTDEDPRIVVFEMPM